MHALFAFFLPLAQAELYTLDVGTGITWNLEVTSDFAVHYARVDLSVPETTLRVTRQGEGPTTSTDFAALTGSIVTINGDWNDSIEGRPLGLSVGNGWHWEGTHDWDGSINPPGDWSFLACRASKECFFDDEYSFQEWDWVWQNVIGGNGGRLVVEGVLRTPAWDANQRPRSAVCLDSTGTELILAVVEGDGAGQNAFAGFTPTELAQYMFDLGCWNAMALDGGGSSNLVILGSRVNDRDPAEPDERSVYNHISVVQTTTTDDACSILPNGRYCGGDVLHTCQGGLDEPADCSVFGLTCEAGDGTAYCVDPTCTNGSDEDVCVDASTMTRCTHGKAGTYDCGAFGFTCEDTAGSARCTHPECPQGGDASWCEGDVLKSCAPDLLGDLHTGVPQDDVDCTASAMVCEDGACVIPAEVPDDGSGAQLDTADTGEDKTEESGGRCASIPSRSPGAFWWLWGSVFALNRRRSR